MPCCCSSDQRKAWHELWVGIRLRVYTSPQRLTSGTLSAMHSRAMGYENGDVYAFLLREITYMKNSSYSDSTQPQPISRR